MSLVIYTKLITVRDNLNSNPIIGAFVQLGESMGYTDNYGQVSISEYAGYKTLTVTAAMYLDRSEVINVASDNPYTVNMIRGPDWVPTVPPAPVDWVYVETYLGVDIEMRGVTEYRFTYDGVIYNALSLIAARARVDELMAAPPPPPPEPTVYPAAFTVSWLSVFGPVTYYGIDQYCEIWVNNLGQYVAVSPDGGVIISQNSSLAVVSSAIDAYMNPPEPDPLPDWVFVESYRGYVIDYRVDYGYRVSVDGVVYVYLTLTEARAAVDVFLGPVVEGTPLERINALLASTGLGFAAGIGFAIGLWELANGRHNKKKQQ